MLRTGIVIPSIAAAGIDHQRQLKVLAGKDNGAACTAATGTVAL
jgi:hypothetical protein